MARFLKPEDVTITILPTDEDLGPRESYAVPGIVSAHSPEADDFVDGVQAMIDAHGLWGWCNVEVRATLGPFTGSDQLGGCSYEDEADFRKGGYFEQMRDAAIDQLEAAILEGLDAVPAAMLDAAVRRRQAATATA